jgi:hypothetical protein
MHLGACSECDGEEYRVTSRGNAGVTFAAIAHEPECPTLGDDKRVIPW